MGEHARDILFNIMLKDKKINQTDPAVLASDATSTKVNNKTDVAEDKIDYQKLLDKENIKVPFLEFPALSPADSESRKRFWEDLRKAVEPNLIENEGGV